jgi:hypothetical protein
MGSGDLPGLQSRRFVPSRVEWWIRLPHASANLLILHRDASDDIELSPDFLVRRQRQDK